MAFHADTDDHSFSKPEGASRAPCPALNALANHGYLPRDGHGITFHNIMDALQKGFGLSPSFALFMAIGTFTLLRRPTLAPFDLYGTAYHGKIEHNASLARNDVEASSWEYAPLPIDHNRLAEFLNMASTTETSEGEDVITMEHIALRRVFLERKCPGLDSLHAELGRAEFALLMEIFGRGQDKEVAKRDAEIFMEQERLPDGWEPSRVIHLRDAVRRSGLIRKRMAELRDALMKQEKEQLKHGDESEEGVTAFLLHRLKTILSRHQGPTNDFPNGHAAQSSDVTHDFDSGELVAA